MAYKKSDYRLILEKGDLEVYVMLERKPEAKRSDMLTVRGVLENGFGNYDAFIYRPELIKVSHPTTPDFALKLRDALAGRIVDQIGQGDESDLALSYLLGQKGTMSPELSEKMRLVGLAHVIVASGFHLGIVVSFAKKYLGKVSRFATLAGATILIIAYISITGFSPSMMRAGFACIMSLFAWYFGRHLHPARSILYLIAISLIINPGYLTNIAWQLSFASYAGIIFLYPLITKFLYGDKQPGKIAGIILVSLAAQLLCLPICIFHFGSMSLVALITNLVVSPVIPVVMLLSLLTGIVPIPLFAFPAKLLLKFQLVVVNYFSGIDWCTLDFGATSKLALLLYIPTVTGALLLKRLTKHSFRPTYALE